MIVDWSVWNRFFNHVASVVVLDQLEDTSSDLMILDQRSDLKTVCRIHIINVYQNIVFPSIYSLLAYDPDPKTKAFGILLEIKLCSIMPFYYFK